MMGYGAGLGFGLGGVLWMIGLVLLLVGLVVLGAWAVSRSAAHDGGDRTPAERNEAVEILRARFARGEITEVEYTQALNVLRSER